MAARLFVVPDPQAPDRARLDAAGARHLRALRLGRGDAFQAIVGPEHERAATILSLTAHGAECRLGARIARGPTNPPAARILAIALGEPSRMDLVIEKATELGASRIEVFRAERSQVAAATAARLERWARIARSACEQCGRTTPPTIEPRKDLAALLEAREPGETMLVASPTGARLAEALAACGAGVATRLALVVGPEGGLSALELARLVERGAIPVSLGPRTLRFETAALAALAAVAACLPEGDAGAPGAI